MPQDDSSSDWLINKLIDLRRLLRETGTWPETGEQLILDLSRFTNASPRTTSPDEDDEMLSIVVNDALNGIDIMKKYPAFYAQMLIDGELRTAFLDTLEVLEQSRAGELPDYPGPATINLDFLRQVMSRPLIRKSAQEKLELIWKRTVEQLQNMFYIASLQPKEAYRSRALFLDTGPLNILNSHFEVDNQELEVRLDALQTITKPDTLDLMMTVFTAEENTRCFQATLTWGAYQASAEINQYGLAKFPSLKTNQIFSPSGDLLHGLELRLEEID